MSSLVVINIKYKVNFVKKVKFKVYINLYKVKMAVTHYILTFFQSSFRWNLNLLKNKQKLNSYFNVKIMLWNL